MCKNHCDDKEQLSQLLSIVVSSEGVYNVVLRVQARHNQVFFCVIFFHQRMQSNSEFECFTGLMMLLISLSQGTVI